MKYAFSVIPMIEWNVNCADNSSYSDLKQTNKKLKISVLLIIFVTTIIYDFDTVAVVDIALIRQLSAMLIVFNFSFVARFKLQNTTNSSN